MHHYNMWVVWLIETVDMIKTTRNGGWCMLAAHQNHHIMSTVTQSASVETGFTSRGNGNANTEDHRFSQRKLSSTLTGILTQNPLLFLLLAQNASFSQNTIIPVFHPKGGRVAAPPFYRVHTPQDSSIS